MVSKREPGAFVPLHGPNPSDVSVGGCHSTDALAWSEFHCSGKAHVGDEQ